MAWSSAAVSARKARLPADWRRRRAVVLDRAGHRCQALDSLGARCTERANQADHITRGDDHSLANLQALCEWHHDRKTAAEAAAVRTVRPTRRRTPEPHPGLLPAPAPARFRGALPVRGPSSGG